MRESGEKKSTHSIGSRLAPWKASAILGAFLILGLIILFGFEKALTRISVDVLDLLPKNKQDVVITLARQTTNGSFGRTLLIALYDPANPHNAPLKAAEDISKQLDKDPSFDGTFIGLSKSERDKLSNWFVDRRLDIRLPIWFRELTEKWRQEDQQIDSNSDQNPADSQLSNFPPVQWLANRVSNNLQEFQASPDAEAAQSLLVKDPLLLIPSLLNDFSTDTKTAKDINQGPLQAEDEKGIKYALIYAEIRYSPLDEPGQKPVFRALAQALNNERAQLNNPTLQIRYSGVNLIAADTRAAAEREINILTNISLGLSCLLILGAFRRLSVFLYLLLPIVTATVWSLIICFVFFEKLHVVTIIFTTVLVGIALDYGIYTLIHAQKSRGNISLRRSLREIRNPLIAGCLTSIGGFIFMILTKLPMLQQMGAAVALGLLFALILDFIYLPWIPAVNVKERTDSIPESPQRLVLDGFIFPIISFLILFTLIGSIWIIKPGWNDDIRTLQKINPKLEKEERALRQLFGRANKDKIVLTFGQDLNEALARQSKLTKTLLALQKQGASQSKAEGTSASPTSDANSLSFFNVSLLFPTLEETEEARNYFKVHSDFNSVLKSTLDKEFNVEMFSPFWDAWDKWNTSLNAPSTTPEEWLKKFGEIVPLPLHNLWSDEKAHRTWVATRMSPALFAKLSFSELSPPNITLDQVAGLTAALKSYRITAIERASIGLALISLILLAAYGWRRGLFMLIIPAISISATIVVLSLIGQSFGLLTVIGLLLGFCLASDYSIFLGSPGNLPHSTRYAIRLAAMTALVSFSVLSFSSLPALRAICLTDASVLAFTIILCELAYKFFVRTATIAKPND